MTVQPHLEHSSPLTEPAPVLALVPPDPVPELVDSLRARIEGVSETRLADLVREAVEGLGEVRVTTYLPVLVERRVRELLTAADTA